MISDDGTKCVKPMSEEQEDPEEKESEKVPAHTVVGGLGGYQPKYQEAAIEADPVQDTNLKVAALSQQIQNLKTKQKILEQQVRHIPQMAMNATQASQVFELERTQKELHRLIKLKKKSS